LGEWIQVSSNEGIVILQGEKVAKELKSLIFFLKSSPEPGGKTQSNLVQFFFYFHFFDTIHR
jgi:hypothetical protein